MALYKYLASGAQWRRCDIIVIKQKIKKLASLEMNRRSNDASEAEMSAFPFEAVIRSGAAGTQHACSRGLTPAFQTDLTCK